MLNVFLVSNDNFVPVDEAFQSLLPPPFLNYFLCFIDKETQVIVLKSHGYEMGLEIQIQNPIPITVAMSGLSNGSRSHCGAGWCLVAKLGRFDQSHICVSSKHEECAPSVPRGLSESNDLTTHVLECHCCPDELVITF